ncbi:MAG: transglutaminase family protein [Polyangiaceae bacterium]|nr:transglutaminase family protein [Polyangiaceae bacterium]
MAPPNSRYFVVHETAYEYAHPVGLSRQLLHLRPRDLPYQTISQFNLTLAPQPESVIDALDSFGNPITRAQIEHNHSSLHVKASYWAEVQARQLPDETQTMPWEDAVYHLTYRRNVLPSPEILEATRYLFESPRVRNKREIANWAKAHFPPRAPLLSCVRALAEHIHSEFVFDPTATTVTTPVTEVFSRRRGVCQDFAHFMMSCLRSLGLAARYVSGYLLTHPPSGRPRMVGADASHAWVSFYLPNVGFVDVDPTNGIFPSNEHVTIGWGRDYEDIAPLRGVLLGGGSHNVSISVTVAPESEYGQLFTPQSR